MIIFKYFLFYKYIFKYLHLHIKATTSKNEAYTNIITQKLNFFKEGIQYFYGLITNLYIAKKRNKLD